MTGFHLGGHPRRPSCREENAAGGGFLSGFGLWGPSRGPGGIEWRPRMESRPRGVGRRDQHVVYMRSELLFDCLRVEGEGRDSNLQGNAPFLTGKRNRRRHPFPPICLT
eukprot:5901516-Pyramimonas_sp.AAC.1